MSRAAVPFRRDLRAYDRGPAQPDRGEAPEPITDPKTRRCLKCRKDFVSAWAGERVCPKCKHSADWRAGHGSPEQGV
jgi:hypothetical protein